MTATELLWSLGIELSDALRNAKLPTEYAKKAEELRGINVYQQYIPADLFANDNYYPCVVAEWVGTEDRISGGCTLNVALSIGVYAKEEDGWQDAFHIMDLIRQRLLTKRVIGKKFRLEGEVVWQPAEQQPTPFFFIYSELKFQALGLVREGFE